MVQEGECISVCNGKCMKQSNANPCNKNGVRYNLIKLMSNFVFGVQSQCFLRAKFDTQKNPDQ